MVLLVCDVEGTIFKAKYRIEGTDYFSTMWQPIAYALGETAVEEERKTHEKWNNKEYDNYLEWVRESIEIHKKYGLERKIFYDLIDEAEYNDGVIEFFKKLDRTKYIPVLISGGFQELVRRAQIELDIDYGFGACEYYFGDEGYISHYNLQPSDFEDKNTYVKFLLRQYKISPLTDWIFIGDGKNDYQIASQAPLAFGINAHPTLLEVEDIINVSSFSEILPVIVEFYDKLRSENIDKQKINLNHRLYKLKLNQNEQLETVDSLINNTITIQQVDNNKLIDELIIKLKEDKADFTNTIHLQNYEIREKFIFAFKEAKKEIDIISPWIGYWVLQNEFIELVEEALKKKVNIKIVYGIEDNSNNGSKNDSTNIIADLFCKKFKKYKELIHMKNGNTHYKLLICDDKFYVAGSFNFLSFNGDYSKPNTRDEGADYSENIEQIKYKKKLYFNF